MERVSIDEEDSEGLENKVAFIGWTNIDEGAVVSWNRFGFFLRWDGVEEDEAVGDKLILHNYTNKCSSLIGNFG